MRHWKFRAAAALSISVCLATARSAGLAEQAAPEAPRRSFSRFELDAGTAQGLWAEVGTAFTRESRGPLTQERIVAGGRLAFGTELVEAGLFLPYLDVDTESDREFGPFDNGRLTQNGIGDLQLYGKVVPLRAGIATAGIGMVLSVPTGDDEDGLGAGEVGFLPFGTAALDLGQAELMAHFGYQAYANASEAVFDQSFVYGGGLAGTVLPFVVGRAEINGETIDDGAFGENPDFVSFEPGVDFHFPFGQAGALIRVTGAVGITSEAPDWGVGGSFVFTLQP